MNHTPRVYTYLKQGNVTYVLCDPQPERPKEMTQPNFMETGLALCAVFTKDKQIIKRTECTDDAREKDRKAREKSNDRLPIYKEDKMLIGTSVLI